MNNDKAVIKDSITQVKKIFEQVSILIRTADGLINKHGWKAENKSVVYGSTAKFDNPHDWLPSVLTRVYRNKNTDHQVLLMGVLLDHAEIEEPLLIGSLLSMKDTEAKFPRQADDDSYFWFLKISSYGNIDEEVLIEDPTLIYESEKRDLGLIKSFAIPLLELESAVQLRDKFVTRLLGLPR